MSTSQKLQATPAPQAVSEQPGSNVTTPNSAHFAQKLRFGPIQQAASVAAAVPLNNDPLMIDLRGQLMVRPRALWPQSVLRSIEARHSCSLDISAADFHAILDIHRDSKLSPKTGADNLVRITAAAKYLQDDYVLREIKHIHPIRVSTHLAKGTPLYLGCLLSLAETLQAIGDEAGAARKQKRAARLQQVQSPSPIASASCAAVASVTEASQRETDLRLQNLTAAEVRALTRKQLAEIEPGTYCLPFVQSQLSMLSSMQLIELSAIQKQRIDSALLAYAAQYSHQGADNRYAATIQAMEQSYYARFMDPIIAQLQALHSAAERTRPNGTVPP